MQIPQIPFQHARQATLQLERGNSFVLHQWHMNHVFLTQESTIFQIRQHICKPFLQRLVLWLHGFLFSLSDVFFSYARPIFWIFLCSPSRANNIQVLRMTLKLCAISHSLKIHQFLHNEIIQTNYWCVRICCNVRTYIIWEGKNRQKCPMGPKF